MKYMGTYGTDFVPVIALTEEEMQQLKAILES